MEWDWSPGSRPSREPVSIGAALQRAKSVTKKKIYGGERDMMKFLLGVIIGILICFLFFYFGGGKTVKKVGEGLTDTGKRMEIMEETIRKEKEGVEKGERG